MAVTRRNLQPDTLHKPVRKGAVLYSNAVSVETKRLVFVAGQLSRDRDGKVVGAGDMRAQIRQVCENVKAALAAANTTFDDVVKISTFVTDIDEFFKHVEVRTEYVGTALPTSTTVEVRRLAAPEYLIEIEAIAVAD